MKRTRIRHRTPPNEQNGLLKQRAGRMRELRRLGLIDADSVVDANPYEVLPELLNNSLGYMRWVRDLVGDLEPDDIWVYNRAGKRAMPGPELEFELRLLNAVRGLAEQIIRLQLDERGVIVEEAKLEIISTALREAARSAGLDEAQQRALGSALREQLQLAAKAGAA